MTNAKLNSAKNQLVDYVLFFQKRNPNYEVEYLINNFFFDYVTELRELKTFSKIEKVSFKKFYSEDKKVEEFVKESLECFITKFEGSRVKNNPISYTETKSEVNSIENIFTGLGYSGNNDTDYKKMPSALSMATFSVK